MIEKDLAIIEVKNKCYSVVMKYKKEIERVKMCNKDFAIKGNFSIKEENCCLFDPTTLILIRHLSVLLRKYF